MSFCLFNSIEIKGNTYFWRDVRKVIDDMEEHHYRVAELSLETVSKNEEIDFFNTGYEAPVYFVPLEILKENDSAVVDWCENNGMYFD